MRLRPFQWLRSLHAKLFLVTALVTSVLTVAVAFSITRNSRAEMEGYSRGLALQTAQAVETEIIERDPTFQNPRAIEEVLGSLAGPDHSIFQIDVFRRSKEDPDRIELMTSSGDDATISWGQDLAPMVDLKEAKSELVDLTTGNKAWKIFHPIRSKAYGRANVGLIRVYCDLERWEDVWRANLRRTLNTLPLVVLGEFILLYVVLGIFVHDPLKAVTDAMGRVEMGEAGARAVVHRKDELGLIADRFNDMADRLQAASLEREGLIEEIQGFNQNLQGRIDEALQELQDRNRELQEALAGNSLLREELSQQERLAVAGQLTAAFAHEVGTPLNLVNGHIQMLRGQGDLSDKAQERLGTIHAQIERVGDIVRKLLDITRRPQLNREALHLGALLDELQRLWAPTLQAHRVAVNTEAPPDCVLEADRKQMEQLFINLVNNAVDALPGGGLITIRAFQEGMNGDWRIEVTDTGAGIPAAVLPQVFKPMFTTKPEGKGTGLGLPICREIVRSHGGDIAIRSVEGQGTTVSFTLPKPA
ncbi:MAG: HAMP domain-containing protein [Holophagaceae bacterium]|nr:HAMP domain-containing protein [Holophagaceae bacterium]